MRPHARSPSSGNEPAPVRTTMSAMRWPESHVEYAENASHAVPHAQPIWPIA